MRTYIWDFDGTLYDTYPAMMEALQLALKQSNLSLDKDELYREIKQTSIRELETRLELTQDFDTLYHRFEAALNKTSRPFADAKETLLSLEDSGGQHLILTHRDNESTWRMLRRDGLAEHIKDIIGSDSGFPRKPDPTAILHFVEKYQLDSKETMMIGDRPLDIAAGKNANVATCLYDIDRFIEDTQADFVVDSLRAIGELSFVR